MVGHEAIGPHRNPASRSLLGQDAAIDVLIARLEEDRLAPIAALGDVMRQTWDDDAGEAGHAAKLARKEQRGN